MKKKILFPALMILSLSAFFVPALSETALAEVTNYESVGISLDFDAVLSQSDYLPQLTELGIIGRNPFISALGLEYIAMSPEEMEELDTAFTNGTDEEKKEIYEDFSKRSTDLAYVIVTDASDPEQMITTQLTGFPEDSSISTFGEADGFHFCLITLPADDLLAGYDDRAEKAADAASVTEEKEKVTADIEVVTRAFEEQLKTAELSAPVDPVTSLIGQTLSFETTDLDGNPVSSKDLFKSNTITMVNLWGTWCGFCVNEMAELAEIHTRLQEKGCGIVGVEFEQQPIEDMAETARSIMEENKTNYPNVLMPEGNSILSSFQSFPTTLFVNSEGVILAAPIEGARVDLYEDTVYSLLSEEAEAIEETGTEAIEETATEAIEEAATEAIEEAATEAVEETGTEAVMETDTAADLPVPQGNEYRVIVTDPDGKPVSDVIIQFCDDTTCSVLKTDENGIAAFTVTQEGVYEVHVLGVPEGYQSDSNVYETPETYSDISISVEKAK